MSTTAGYREFSGGLTVEDLREAWLMVPTQLSPAGRMRLPRETLERLCREWRRSAGGVQGIIATLRQIERGDTQSPGDKSTLWRMTEAERAYVFTGAWPDPEAEPEPEPACADFRCVHGTSDQESPAELVEGVPAVTWLAGIHGQLAEIAALQRELVGIWRGAEP